MRKIKTLLITLTICLSTFSVFADELPEKQDRKHSTILIIGADPQKDDIWIIKNNAIDIYTKTLKYGFQQSEVPNFIISDRFSNAVFGIGGFVNFRTSYNWNNVIGSKDFDTYDIPMLGTPKNRQSLLMDASTTRLFFKTILQAGSLGQVEAYIETDFRGRDNVLHLREAYISFLGLTLGQTTTTFADLKASPNTIDFEGPNAFTYKRNLMIRYNYDLNTRWNFAIALEMPNVSATTVEKGAYIIPQQIPDIPLYAQYNWDKGKSHVRASGVFRAMNYYDNTLMSKETVLGWGAMLSTNIELCPWANFFGQVVYGEGIENYIADLGGNGLDLVPNKSYRGQLQTLPAMGWFAGFQTKFMKDFQMNVTYSQVNVWNKNNYFEQAPDTYKMAQYIVANVFYNILPALEVGVEYLYGTRKNADNVMKHANCAQVMIQFTF